MKNGRMLLSNFNLLATAPGGVARLRELMLTLAVQGKLVPQDPGDEPASVLLKKIRAEKDRLIAGGKIRRDKPLTKVADEEKPFEAPKGWEWSTLAAIGIINPRNNADDDVTASFVQMSSIPVGFLASHITEPRPWRDIKSGFTQFAEGDVGVAKITPCFENGKSTVFQNLSNGIGAGTTELHIVRPLCEIAPRYVLLFLKTPSFLIEGEAMMTGSAGQKRMPRNYFENKPFLLPPLAEQSRIVTRVEELMRVCDALEAKGKLEAAQHAQLLSTLLGTLTSSDTPEALVQNWQRIATHFDLLLDRPQAIDAFEKTILQLAVRGLLVPQDPSDEPANVLLQKIRAEKDRLISEGKIKRDKPLPPVRNMEKPFDLPLGWTGVRFAELGEFRGGKTPSTQRTDFWSGDIPWITPKDMKQLRLSDSEDKVTKKAVDDGLALVPTESVLMVVRSGILRRTFPTAINEVVTTINQDLKALVLVRPGMAAYIQLLMRGFEDFILEHLTKIGTTVESIQFDAFTAQSFPLPPLAEQSRIVTRVEELFRLCADLRQRLSASQTTQAHLAEALVESVAGQPNQS